MNNDSTPTPAAALPSNPSNTLGESAQSTRPRNVLSPAQKRFQAQITKKVEFIDDLIKHSDMLIYMELCVLYYMDCSFFRLLLRSFMQLIFLTPKPAAVPGVAPTHRPWVYVILGPNLICMLLHLFTSRPEAGESMRGYLHGGIIIDLIGQKGPTSKTHLLLLDVLVLALQCFMLAVVMEKDRLGTVLKAYTSPNSAANRSTVPRAEIQDLDAEERGVVRDSVAENGDIELGTMRNREPPSLNGREPNTGGDSDRAALLAEPPPREHSGGGLDTFWSGRAIIADLHILQVIRMHWRDYGIMNGEATESAWQNVGFRAARSMILLRTEMPAGR